ncbi:hypothetical protein BDY24DRAFT_266839 [Mrakia frigida]|uniref:uncharacterized protein n=1 Tax=Mrakia frigida TaxID=29902 RepID=UPI003FCC2185
MASSSFALLSLLLVGSARAHTPENAPDKTQEGQTGTNQCGTGSSQDSMCQNAYINSVTDFCLWAPPSTTSDYGDSAIGNTERIEVAWCVQGGHGTRVIPDGAISGAHFVQTPHYVQITGVGDLTKLNIPAGDDGGELDPHGADGNGNPIGGLVFSSAFGNGVQQVNEWTNFMSSNAFCFRICTGDNAAGNCQHIYDVLGCGWNQPGDYSSGSFDNCAGDAVEAPGVYGTSTFYQGDAMTPDAHPAGATSQCTSFATIANGLDVNAALPTTAAATTTTAVTTFSTSTAATTSSTAAVVSSSPSVASSTSSIALTTTSSSSSSAIASSTASVSASRVAVSSSAARSSASGLVRNVSASASASVSSSSGSEGRVGVWGVAVAVGLVGLAGGLML